MIIFDYIGQSINEKEGKSTASKSKVRTYSTIDAALGSDTVGGDLFTTKGSDRIYIVTAKPWGDKTQSVHGKTAKGFSPGKDQSPKNPSFKAIKNAGERAAERAGVRGKDKNAAYHHSRKEAGEGGASEDK